ncbi:MAG: hypothetical protein QOJ34_728 [Pseudonocardiales bacterium]|nr:hypothetical protein [Pseudonocardiales bacterium]
MGRLDRVSAQAWSVCGASVIGSAHVRRSVENQDAFRCGARPEAPVAVVADGHGAAEYVRSATGARLAADLLAAELADVGRADDAHAVHEDLQIVAARFIDRWRTAVLADAAAEPFSAAEQDALATQAGRPEEVAVRAYGTTVLGVCVAAGWVRAVAIGDGDVGCVDAAGGHRTLCPQPAAIGVQTDSLAADDPYAAVRTDACPADDIVAVWACTDGFSTAQADPGWRGLVGGQLRGMLATRTAAEIEADLDGWLAPAAAVGDDTTMVLVLRDEFGDRPPRDGEPKRYDLLAPTVPPRERRRRALWRRL